jgi:hypothetical protein
MRCPATSPTVNLTAGSTRSKPWTAVSYVVAVRLIVATTSLRPLVTLTPAGIADISSITMRPGDQHEAT